MAAVNKYFLLHAGSVLKMWNFLLCLAAFAAPLAAGHEQGQWAQLYDTLKAEVADLQALKAEVAQLRARNELLSNSLHDARRNLLSVEAPPKMPKINWNSYVGVNIKQKKGMFSIGEKSEIKMYNDASGKFTVLSPKGVDFITPTLTLNGKPFSSGGGGGGGFKTITANFQDAKDFEGFNCVKQDHELWLAWQDLRWLQYQGQVARHQEDVQGLARGHVRGFAGLHQD